MLGKFKKKKPQAPDRIAAIAQSKQIEPKRHREGRYAERVPTYRDSTVYLPSGKGEPCIIVDMSETGAGISCQVASNLPEYVNLSAFGQRYLCRTVWRRGISAGLEYCALDDE